MLFYKKYISAHSHQPSVGMGLSLTGWVKSYVIHKHHYLKCALLKRILLNGKIILVFVFELAFFRQIQV